MVNSIGIPATLDLLTAIADEAGEDYFVDECMYSDVTCTVPVCIVGTVVHKLGGVAALKQMQEGASCMYMGNKDVLTELGFTSGAIMVLRRAQSIQDVMKTWAVAAQGAYEYATRNPELV